VCDAPERRGQLVAAVRGTMEPRDARARDRSDQRPAADGLRHAPMLPPHTTFGL